MIVMVVTMMIRLVLLSLRHMPLGPLPVSNNKFKKRQGAEVTKKLEQLESVGRELNLREATNFKALAARCNYLAQDRPRHCIQCKRVAS